MIDFSYKIYRNFINFSLVLVDFLAQTVDSIDSEPAKPLLRHAQMWRVFAFMGGLQ